MLPVFILYDSLHCKSLTLPPPRLTDSPLTRFCSKSVVRLIYERILVYTLCDATIHVTCVYPLRLVALQITYFTSTTFD